MIKILIADDHVILREGLKRILSETSDIIVADEAGTADEAIEKVRKDGFNLVLLDISMPETSGLEVLQQLKKERPELPVLILTMYPEEQYAVKALRMGASGYLTKDSAVNDLVKAIRHIREGRKYVTPSLAEKLAYLLDINPNLNPHEALSKRELKVMEKIIAGKKLKDIASEMSISEKTVSTYRNRILEKMDMNSNADLVRYAIEKKLFIN